MPCSPRGQPPPASAGSATTATAATPSPAPCTRSRSHPGPGTVRRSHFRHTNNTSLLIRISHPIRVIDLKLRVGFASMFDTSKDVTTKFISLKGRYRVTQGSVSPDPGRDDDPARSPGEPGGSPPGGSGGGSQPTQDGFSSAAW